MVKKMFSFLPVHQAKLMKKRVGKKRLLLKSVLDFLKSDDYMFAPLFSSQESSCTISSTGVEAYNEPMNKGKKNLNRKVKDYMKSDCYMYASLVSNELWLRAAVSPAPDRPGPVSSSCEITANTISQRVTTKTVGEENNGLGQTTKSVSVTDKLVDGYPYTRSAVIRHSLLQKETVKHVIQQNICPPPEEGDKKKEKRGRKGGKLKGSKTDHPKRKKKVTRRSLGKLASEHTTTRLAEPREALIW